MIDAFTSTIVGAVVGGGFSLLASYITSKESHKTQNDLYEKQIQKETMIDALRAERYSNLLMTEMISWIEIAVYRVNLVRSQSEVRPLNLDYNENFRIYIDSIIDKLTFKESQDIIKFYGMIKQMSIHLLNHSFFDVNCGAPKELNLASLVLLKNIYSENNIEYFKMTDPSLISQEIIISKLNDEYKSLFKNINEIAGRSVSIN